MSATAVTDATAPPVAPTPKRDELELNCIFCLQHAGSSERVIYWPPRRDAPGVIAHKRCYDQAASS
jgi:hypothetical protein